ncbi:MAG: tRNA uridine-5-carboxymethylaminomethyl(34) synthesis enzyme MnmG [Muribaculaceae bacterium]|nr:tRNA uridine-5-carboxymethylaminomethyl(34) synthesis enzyme MnmG [Muribaculaceae bacterium]
MNFEFDVIVIGAGHAGCEAAAAAASLGCRTLLITPDMNRIAQMSCNPAVGGIAKGQIVREIDALGGRTGIIADRTAIQFRMLNRSKGPAVWSPRVQSDRTRFIDEWRKTLDSIPNLHIFQDMVTSLDIHTVEVEGSALRHTVTGVRTALGIPFKARRVVLTAGTFLNGLMHFGRTQIAGGRIAEAASEGVSDQLRSLGIRVDRMKTGTPARIDGSTIDLSQATAQAGDDVVREDGSVERDFHKFSYLPEVSRSLPPRDCYIVHTDREVHRVLNDNLADSPLYNGQIKSIGPRYCPSIETKIVTFADKESHQLFLEPEGATTHEFYINGFSSSLPWQVQVEALQKIPALREVHFYRPGYAIEYDFFDPTQLRHSLESKVVSDLYLAGQVNGTTGYEEAAAQGLMAGINAARSVKGLPPVVLGRDQAYIGVLIDDLVTKGVDEPYRMFTSRAEFRILLRQDDADLRLTPLGHEIGLASDARYEAMKTKYEQRDSLVEWCETHSARPSEELQAYLEEVGTGRLSGSVKVADLIRRPQLSFASLLPLVPSLAKRCSEVEAARMDEIIESAEILIKYSGYISRERESAERMQRLEKVRMPASIDFSSISALSTEARQKLTRIRPETIGQASRIPGVSPADINVLLVMLRN